MSVLIGNPSNLLLDLVHRGGMSYGQSMIPLGPASVNSQKLGVPAPNMNSQSFKRAKARFWKRHGRKVRRRQRRRR